MTDETRQVLTTLQLEKLDQLQFPISQGNDREGRYIRVGPSGAGQRTLYQPSLAEVLEKCVGLIKSIIFGEATIWVSPNPPNYTDDLATGDGVNGLHRLLVDLWIDSQS